MVLNLAVEKMYPLAHIGFAVLVNRILNYHDLISYMDMRYVLVGSLLPDIIDKPIGLIFNISGRGAFHSLIVIVFFYFVLSVKFFDKDVVVSSMVFGSIIHILLDRIFLSPRIFLWPLLGFRVPVSTITVNSYFQIVFNSLYVQVTELIGLLILIGFIINYNLYKKDDIIEFVLRNENKV